MTTISSKIPRETLRGYLFIVLAAFCWGGIGPVSRYAFAQGLAPFVRIEFPAPRALLAVIFLAVISTFAAYSLNYAGLKRLESSRAATVATIEPVIAGAAAWVWWGETFTFWGYLGSGLILLGVLLLITSSSKEGAS
ncbi:MAG: DMT family transporter [Candidatus Krumholzibacteriota bacterium]